MLCEVAAPIAYGNDLQFLAAAADAGWAQAHVSSPAAAAAGGRRRSMRGRRAYAHGNDSLSRYVATISRWEQAQQHSSGRRRWLPRLPGRKRGRRPRFFCESRFGVTRSTACSFYSSQLAFTPSIRARLAERLRRYVQVVVSQDSQVRVLQRAHPFCLPLRRPFGVRRHPFGARRHHFGARRHHFGTRRHPLARGGTLWRAPAPWRTHSGHACLLPPLLTVRMRTAASLVGGLLRVGGCLLLCRPLLQLTCTAACASLQDDRIPSQSYMVSVDDACDQQQPFVTATAAVTGAASAANTHNSQRATLNTFTRRCRTQHSRRVGGRRHHQTQHCMAWQPR